MTELPAPLTPADCDLRGLPYIPLHGDRLVDSDLFFSSTGDEFKAAFALWWASWKQVPAASLPDNDRVLAGLARVMDAKKWAKIRDMALHKWIKCSDGRLYHPVVAEMALTAWADRQDMASAKANDTERKRAEREERRGLFAKLKAAGVHLPWNTPMQELRARASSCPAPVLDLSSGQVVDCPPPVTAKKRREENPPVVPQGTGKDFVLTSEDVERCWSLAPQPSRRRSSAADLERSLRAALRRGQTLPDIERGLRAYFASDDATKDGGKLAKGVHRMVENDRWQSFVEDGKLPLEWTEDLWAIAVSEWRRTGEWGETMGPKPGEPGCRVPAGLLVQKAAG